MAEKVVVCRPLRWLSEMLPVRSASPGSSVPTSVDLPTPELPATSVVQPVTSARTASSPVPSSVERSTTR